MNIFEYSEKDIEVIGTIGKDRGGTIRRLCKITSIKNVPRYIIQVCDIDTKGEIDPNIGILFSKEDLQSFSELLNSYLNR